MDSEEIPSYMAAAFDAEPTDARWSGETRAAIWGALHRHESATVTVQDVECRSETCRVRISFADADARMKTLKEVFITGPDHEVNAFALYAPPPEQAADGRLESKVYLFRK
jgi:hypothetical protein